jgi:hypothetical protein
MTAKITLVDGKIIKETCYGFNTWSGDDQIRLIVGKRDALPIIHHSYPKSSVKSCVIFRDDGSLFYKTNGEGKNEK